MSKAKLLAAREFIQEKRYGEARTLLETMPDEPTAQKWLAKLAKVATPPRRQRSVIPAPPPLPASAYANQSAMSNRGYTAYDLDRSNARMKSYTGAVVIVMVLYCVFFIPGIIANVLYHNEGQRMEALAGEPLPGVRALGILRKLMFVLLLLIAIPLAVVIAGRLM